LKLAKYLVTFSVFLMPLFGFAEPVTLKIVGGVSEGSFGDSDLYNRKNFVIFGEGKGLAAINCYNQGRGYAVDSHEIALTLYLPKFVDPEKPYLFDRAYSETYLGAHSTVSECQALASKLLGATAERPVSIVVDPSKKTVLVP
jgi:hypothetical protein